MSSYIAEIHLNPWNGKSAHNGNGRPANYTGSYDERKSGTHHKKRSNYKPSNNSAVVIIHDPLGFHNGGFRPGAVFGEIDWEKMRSSRVITENTIFFEDKTCWRMVTLKDCRGNKMMKRVKVV